jgi:glycine/D-amino acid oxidase-like deaminating enzyme
LRHGATAIYGQQVVELVHENGHISGVKTNTGQQYHANHVIVAAGAWSNTLLRTVGLTLPLYRVVATRIIGEVCGVPDCLPTVMIPEQGAWIREHQGALMWGTGDGYAAVYDLPQIATVGTRPYYPELVTSLTNAVQASFQRLFPAVDMSVANWTQGMPAYTADRTFIAGAVPGIHGLWAVTGDNEAGVTHAPALGRMLAELVTQHARTDIDYAKFGLERFTHVYADEQAVAAAMPPRR